VTCDFAISAYIVLDVTHCVIKGAKNTTWTEIENGMEVVTGGSETDPICDGKVGCDVS
jgi:hypothetical protein